MRISEGSSTTNYQIKWWLSLGGSLSIAGSVTEASITALSLVRLLDRIDRGHHTYGLMYATTAGTQHAAEL